MTDEMDRLERVLGERASRDEEASLMEAREKADQDRFDAALTKAMAEIIVPTFEAVAMKVNAAGHSARVVPQNEAGQIGVSLVVKPKHLPGMTNPNRPALVVKSGRAGNRRVVWIGQDESFSPEEITRVLIERQAVDYVEVTLA